ncbi:MAG TPA: hypothetical protein VFL57_17230, partial [Bryobacteraceae bacterium]|nr:hypothetical protein [Bryobacteraceae bacterium]
EILRQIRLTAFLNREKPDYSPESRRRAADRLVEQALIRREMAAAPGAQGQKTEIAPEVLAILRNRYPTDAAYRRALAEYRLSDEDVKRHLEWQTRLLRFVDVRFRPGVQINETEIREYYENVFVTEWRGRNKGAPPSFDDVRAQIENDMLSERANSALDRWLGQTRTQTRIRYRRVVFQ